MLARAQQVIRDSGTVPLKEITGGDWDRVHVFPAPTTQESVEATVGAPIDMPDIYGYDERGGILVFVAGGTVQRAVALRPYPFDGNGASYGPDVIAASPYPDAGWLRLAEPAASK